MGKVKSLGVIVDEGLKWKDQLKSLTGKVAGGLSSLRKLKDVLPQSKLCDVYRALFESHLRYGNVVWGSLSPAELQALQRLQNRALSIIENARFKDQWPKKWLNVESLIRLIVLYWSIRFSTSYALKAYGICSNLDRLYLITILEMLQICIFQK